MFSRLVKRTAQSLFILALVLLGSISTSFAAAPAIPFTVTMSEAVNISGTPRIILDVGGTTRYATYSAGTGTSSLTFTYTATLGDLDLDGIGIASTTLDLNGGNVTDLNGNPETNLTFVAPANMSSVKVSYPSLSMDFTNGTGGRYTLNGNIYTSLSTFLSAASASPFSRGSSATYFNSSGIMQTASNDVARFDHDPVTLQPKGILIEGSRINLIPYSESFSLSYNPSGATLTTDAGTAPDGANSAELITMATSSVINFTSGYAATSGIAYTASIFFKPLSMSNANFNIYVGRATSACGRSASFGHSSGSISAIDGSSFVTPLNNGWFRLVMPYTASCTFTDGNFTISGSAFTVGSTFLVWGRMAEQAAFATSYIPTTTTTASRSTDTLIIPTGSWFNGTEGTMTTLSSLPYVGGTSYPGTMAFDDGTQANSMHIFISDAFASDRKSAEIFLGGGVQLYEAGAGYTAGALLRQGLAYKANDSVASMDGVLGTLDSSVTLPTVTRLCIGLRRGCGDPLNGYIQKAKYYPTRVSNTQLQLLTQ